MVQWAGPIQRQEVSRTTNKKCLTVELYTSLKFVSSQIHFHFIETVLGRDHKFVFILW